MMNATRIRVMAPAEGRPIRTMSKKEWSVHSCCQKLGAAASISQFDKHKNKQVVCLENAREPKGLRRFLSAYTYIGLGLEAQKEFDLADIEAT